MRCLNCGGNIWERDEDGDIYCLLCTGYVLNSLIPSVAFGRKSRVDSWKSGKKKRKHEDGDDFYG